jgi:hypothetical protein
MELAFELDEGVEGRSVERSGDQRGIASVRRSRAGAI